MRLEGKIGIVTGGGTGIGRASALAMAAEGASIVIGNRSAATGEEVCNEIIAAGGKALFKATDCAKPEDCEALIAFAEAEMGQVDLAFCNAGKFHDTLVPTHEMSVEEASYGIDLNLKGIFYTMKYSIAAMLRAGGGAVVNNASIYSFKGIAGLNWYTASKHGIIGLTRCAGLEYARQNIRVNALCPGNTKTAPLDAAAGGAAEDVFSEEVPLGRVAMPEEIAEGVVWLLSDESRYITGTAVNMDGGMIAG